MLAKNIYSEINISNEKTSEIYQTLFKKDGLGKLNISRITTIKNEEWLADRLRMFLDLFNDDVDKNTNINITDIGKDFLHDNFSKMKNNDTDCINSDCSVYLENIAEASDNIKQVYKAILNGEIKLPKKATQILKETQTNISMALSHNKLSSSAKKLKNNCQALLQWTTNKGEMERLGHILRIENKDEITGLRSSKRESVYQWLSRVVKEAGIDMPQLSDIRMINPVLAKAIDDFSSKNGHFLKTTNMD